MAPAAARNTQPVAIAGGGIGGLACALALARKGFRSLVLEQAREFGEVGVGLHVAPNALSVLDALGVGAAAKKNALMIERLLMMDAVTGEEVANIPCDARFEQRFGLGLRDQRHDLGLGFAITGLAGEFQPDVIRIEHID